MIKEENRGPVTSVFSHYIKGVQSIMIFDEIGNPGREPVGDDDTFVFTAAETDKPIRFGTISRWLRLLQGIKEVKAKEQDPEIREKRLMRINSLGTEIHAVFIDKNADDNPKWWKERESRNSVYREVLSELAYDAFSRTACNDILVVLDYHKALDNGHGESIIRKAAEENGKRLIGVMIEDSETGKHRDLIQTNDFIPRGARDTIKGSDHGLSANIRRINGKNARKR